MGAARTRDIGTARTAGVKLRRWAPVVGLTLACGTVLGDLDRIVAIEIVGTTAPTVEEGDTLRLSARALDAAGDPVPEAVVVWELLDADTGQLGFTLDSLTGLISASFPGSGRVRARVEELRSGPLTVTVTAAPDSIAAVSAVRVTVAAAATESAPLTTMVYDLTTVPGQALALAGKAVHYELAVPPAGSAAAGGVLLALPDGQPGSDPHRVVAVTGGDGLGSAVLQRADGAQPDSAIVEARTATATGIAVAGSPVRFVVFFEKP